MPEGLNKNKEESYQEYLDKLLEQTKQAYEKWSQDYKKNLDTKLNNFFIQEIKKVELEYKEKRENIVDEFKKEMEDFEKRKAKEPDTYGLLAREEKMYKESFERQIRSNENALKATIEMFESKMQ